MITHCVLNLFCWPLVALGVTVAIGKVKEDPWCLGLTVYPNLTCSRKTRTGSLFQVFKEIADPSILWSGQSSSISTALRCCTMFTTADLFLTFPCWFVLICYWWCLLKLCVICSVQHFILCNEHCSLQRMLGGLFNLSLMLIFPLV